MLPATFPQPIQLDTVPPEAQGSKCVYVSVYWQAVFNASGGFIAQINLLSQYQTGQFTGVQAVFVDNSTCPEMVTLTATDTQMQIKVPPFAKGLYPLISGQAPAFTLQLNLNFDPVYGQAYSNCTTKLFFLNTPQRGYFEALASNFGQNINTYWTATLNYGAGVNALALTAAGGSGLQSLGAGLVYAFSSIHITILAQTAYAAAQVITYGLSESGNSGPFARYEARAWATLAVGPIVDQHLTFPVPIMQIDPLNSFNFFVTPVPAAAASVLVSLNISYSIVQIS